MESTNSTSKKDKEQIGVFAYHEYIDIVEKQKKQFDSFFALKLWRPNPVLHPEVTKAITDKILASPRLKDVINQLVSKGHGSFDSNIAQARGILDEMGHTYRLSTVRMIGFFLAKLLRQMYQGVAINKDGVSKLSKAMSQGPVLILPTHRSYADFLLVSYLCYTLDIPLPVIAAGMDFKGMKFVNNLLQNAGAFYIRRSFGQDLLYWCIVSEYIQYHINDFQAPIEFFLEGTRSRNGKSLPPKTGLLSMALEPYLKGDVPDIQICTISISYERILEDNLYAYEVLGIPKPKESTSGFLNAVGKIRNQSYGRIYVNVSDPISVREKLSKRDVPEWGMPSYRFSLDTDEKKNIYSLAMEMVCKQQKDAITPISAILFAVLVFKQLELQELVDYVVLFNSLLTKYGTCCFIKGQVVDSVRDCLEAHKLLFCCDSKGLYSYQPAEKTKDLQARAAARLVVQQYTNQLLAPLINIAVYGLIRHQYPDLAWGDSAFFTAYFKDEFVLIRNITESNLSEFSVIKSEVIDIIFPLLHPYIESFYILLRTLELGFATTKDIQTQYRNIASSALNEGATNFSEILAVDKVPRHLLNLVANGNIRQVKSNQVTSYHVINITSLISKLEYYLDQQFKNFVISQHKNSVRISSQL